MTEALRLLFGIFLYAASFIVPAAGVLGLIDLVSLPPTPPDAASGYAAVVLSILAGGGCTYWLLGTRLWNWVESGEWKTSRHPVQKPVPRD